MLPRRHGDAVAVMADVIDDERSCQPRRAPMKNSILPSPPVIDEGNTSMSVQPSEAANAEISSQISWCTIALRMMPRLECFRVRLELRLDQRQAGASGARQRQRHRQHAFSEMKLTSMTTTSGRAGRRLPSKLADIGLFHRDDLGMAAQRGMQLAAPDIDGEDEAGAVRQQHLGEAAGGCADVEADMVLDLDRILLQRAGRA
jgi:hypothetical protein